MGTDAAALSRAFEPPEVVLPRLAWLPVVGRFLSRVLPPRRHVGRVLSYQEFQPFQAAFAAAMRLECATCGRGAPACECPEERRDHRSAMPEDEFAAVCRDFIRAQGLPVRPMMALPGAVLYEAMRDFFFCQTRANLPRSAMTGPTSGSGSRARAGTRPAGTRSPSRTPTRS